MIPPLMLFRSMHSEKIDDRRMKKRSVSIRGHRTSFSIEDEFWDELKAIAVGKQMSLAQLVTQVDIRRSPEQNLSSALRLYVLNFIKTGA